MFQLPSNQLITKPFCALGTNGVDYVLPPISGSSASTVQTQEYGIPPVQQQDPDFGGLPVLRSETNGSLRFYSNVLNFINQGGQFTFDATQAIAIGGYRQGAVLYCNAINGYLISLINNNTANFITTPSYINDGIHWQTLYHLQSDFNKIKNVGNISNYTIQLSDAFSLILHSNTSQLITYLLPNYQTLPIGFTVCIKNQLGFISDGIAQINTNVLTKSNVYFKCQVGDLGWIVDNQLINTYHYWATVANTKNQYKSEMFTVSAMWTCPENVTRIYVTLIGGGSGGGNGGNNSGGGGGNSGFLKFKQEVYVNPKEIYFIIIGNGGDPNTNGGDTTFSSDNAQTRIVANGGTSNGNGGNSGAPGQIGGAGGHGGAIWIAGGGFAGDFTNPFRPSGNGGNGVYGGGGGGNANNGSGGGAGGAGVCLIEY